NRQQSLHQRLPRSARYVAWRCRNQSQISHRSNSSYTVASHMKVTFGEFQYSTDARRLTKAGRTVRLSDQSLRLLTLLLERPGEVVTRDEIRQALWPETHVDFDHSLNVALNRLRQSLGGKESQFIETVPKLGYRFIA